MMTKLSQIIMNLFTLSILVMSLILANSAFAKELNHPGDNFIDCEKCPEMVVLPTGIFSMGSTQAVRKWYLKNGGTERFSSRELPRHIVKINGSIAIAKYEITRAQYKIFMNTTKRTQKTGCYVYTNKWQFDSDKNWHDPGFPQAENDPVVCVSWKDAKAYAEWLSDRTGMTYRLPSEAEWEYAARGGSTSMRYWGNDANNVLSCKFANVRDNKNFKTKTFSCADEYPYTSPVGSFHANNFGLYDMLGNVWEWVEDCFNQNYIGAPSDGLPWIHGDCRSRVLRGAGWAYAPRNLRAARRGKDQASKRSGGIGFRVLKELR
jgi:formylglycine-generating enzyme